MYYYSANPWYSRISNSNLNSLPINQYCNDSEENEVSNRVEQSFEISDIEGSSLNGPITNTQIQVVINLAFDDIIILLGGIGSLEDLQNSIPGIETEDGKFKLNVKEGNLVLNGKEMKLEKKVLENDKTVLVFKTETQDLQTNESNR